MIITARAAYGRVYNSQKAIKADWLLDKDFQTVNGQYINKTDAVSMGVSFVNIRYKNDRSVMAIKVGK